MSDKDIEKLRKYYIKMVTSPQFSYPPKTKTEAGLDWLIISVAIEGAFNDT